MTKIKVDKITALRAVAEYFKIPMLGTQPTSHKGAFRLTDDIEIEFDFECKDTS